MATQKTCGFAKQGKNSYWIQNQKQVCGLKAIDRFCERRNAPRDVASSLTSRDGTQKPFEQARVALTVNGDAGGRVCENFAKPDDWIHFSGSLRAAKPFFYVVRSHVEGGSDTPPGILGSKPHRRRGSEATRATRGGHYHKKTLRAPAPPPPAAPRPRRRARAPRPWPRALSLRA